MTDRQKLIIEFIKCFYEKAKTNRRHNKNAILNLTKLTNRVCDLYLGGQKKFTEEEILEGFEQIGYLTLKPLSKNIHLGEISGGHRKYSLGCYINVKSQRISDLVMASKNGYPIKSNKDTILRVGKLKQSLREFAEKHS